MKILVVDDDQALLSLVSFALRQAGYLALEAADAAQAIDVFEREQPDLVILDVNLPPGAPGAAASGFDVLHHIREQARTPVMLLTVRSAEEDEVRGLDLGADDYMNKPFSPRTLLARVRALLRRADSAPASDEPGIQQGGHAGVFRPLRAGDLTLDPENQAVSVRGQPPARLTKLEYRLLQYLFVNAGHTLPAERLTQHVWGYRGAGDRQMLKQLVHRLRQKIERDPAAPEYVLTVAGTGYVLDAASHVQISAAKDD
jgi:DNA-binding response OmpR family regulator